MKNDIWIVAQLFDVTTRRLMKLRLRAMLLSGIEDSALGYENCSWVFGWHDPNRYYVNEDGEVARIGDGGPLDPGK